jgi:hypothetical protein
MSQLRTRLEADIRPAMRARDRVRISAIRTTLSAISNAEAVTSTGSVVHDTATTGAPGVYASEARRRELTEDEVRAIVTAERDGFRADAGHLRELDQHDEADTLEGKAAVLDGYLDT